MRYILSVALVALFSSPVFADGTCSNTAYPLVDSSVKFGMTTAQLKKAIRPLKKKANVVNQDNITVLVFKKPYKNLDKIIYLAMDGKVTRVAFSYSNEFQRKLGGRLNALQTMLEKLVEKHGKADDVDFNKEKGRVEALWGNNKGATLRVIADDSDGSMLMRIDCDELEGTIMKAQKKSANFGF